MRTALDAGPEPVPDMGGADAAADDMHVADADSVDASNCAEPLVAPVAPLSPQAGELFYAQLGLGGLSMGESALLVGPDGTVVLIDVANSSHDDDIEDALNAITGGTTVNHIVLTHFHADHGDGLADLLGRVTLTGRIVHRGFTDLTAAANAATIDSVCESIAARASADTPLCSAAVPAPCSESARSGTYPATACDGFTSADLSLGADARIDFIAANGRIGSENYESSVEAIDATDSNGENARSVVAVVSQGAFRMLVAGDLTGGGSDTNDVESFYASRLGDAGVGVSGVDVLHAGHHGRNTSTNTTWANRLLPNDGRSRNVVMGISTLHLQSPHAEVLATLLDESRLNDGRVWTTTVSTGGATAEDLVDADGGMVVLATFNGGATYAVQAIASDGRVIASGAYRSVGACP